MYPRVLCQCICEGVAAQKKVDRSKLQRNEIMTIEEIIHWTKVVSAQDLTSCGQDEAEATLHDEARVEHDVFAVVLFERVFIHAAITSVLCVDHGGGDADAPVFKL